MSFPPTVTANINSARNNLLGSQIKTLNLSSKEARSLLSSPHNFLSKLSDKEAEHVRSVLIPAYRKGFMIIFVVGAALAAAAFFLAFGLMPQVGLSRKDDEKLKEEGKRRVQGGSDGNGENNDRRDVEEGKQ